MQHFAPVPEDIPGARLPEPVRLRVMEELEGDASALLAHFRDRGMTEEAATREVQEWLGTRPEVWRELEEIHRPIMVRWADRMLKPRGHRVERTGLVLAAVLLVAAAIPLRIGVVVQAAFGTGWVVVAMACGIVVLVVQWWIRGLLDPATRAAPRDMLALLGLGAPVVGLLGAGLTLSHAGEGNLAMWSAIEVASGIATLGLMVGIAGGVSWSVQKAWRGINSPAEPGGV